MEDAPCLDGQWEITCEVIEWIYDPSLPVGLGNVALLLIFVFTVGAVFMVLSRPYPPQEREAEDV